MNSNYIGRIKKEIWTKRCFGLLILVASLYVILLNLIVSLYFDFYHNGIFLREPFLRLLSSILNYTYSPTLKFLIHPVNFHNPLSEENIFVGVSYIFFIVGVIIFSSGNFRAKSLRSAELKVKQRKLERALDTGADSEKVVVNVIENYIKQDKEPWMKQIIIGIIIAVIPPIILTALNMR